MPSKVRECRSFKFEKRASGDGEENYIVEGYFSTYDDPYELYRDGKYIAMEKVDRNAFNGVDTSDTVFQIDHEGRVYARTRNGSIELDFNAKEGPSHRTNLGLTSSSRGVYEDIDAGLYDRMSFAFTVAEDEFTEEERENGDVVVLRTIKKIDKLYDISAVSFPANPNTSISARSKEAFDGEIERFEAERLRLEEIENRRKAIIDRLTGGNK